MEETVYTENVKPKITQRVEFSFSFGGDMNKGLFTPDRVPMTKSSLFNQ